MRTDSSREVKNAFPWTPGLTRESGGGLSFAGRDLSAFLTREAPQNPFYLLSLDVVVSRAKAMQARLAREFSQPLHFHFAMKSNFNPALLKRVSSEGFGVDLVSGGELDRALECGFVPSKIVFSGVAKTEAEILKALRADVGQLNVESLPELQRITRIAGETGKRARFAVRVNPEVRAETHPSIATGFRENKFGVDILDFPEVLDWIVKHPRELDFQGLSLHIGSQLTDFAALEEALEKTLRLEADILARGIQIHSLDVGGGVGISYRGEEADDVEILEKYVRSLKQGLGSYSRPLRFEPGRFWVARAGVLVTRVEYVKRTAHKNFLILNAGMNALMRPALYGAHHRFEVFPLREGKGEVFDVVGPVCESGDTVGKLREFCDPREKDFICVGEAGAYGKVLANEYNLLGETKELIWEELHGLPFDT